MKNIKKVYDKDVVAVHDFTLDIKDKEFVLLIGPSGCGKSTTLRMIAGLEDITAGELYIGGTLVNNVAPKDRDIAMVFQNYSLYPHMTVYDNMAFALKLRKYPKAEIDRRVREAAEILNISELLKRKPKALSGGQRQRVAIGRAIVREPKVFLMDEPLSNLDAKLRNQMRAELIKLRQRIDTTFVYVTHDQTEAMTLGDKLVIMKDGFIQQIGTPNELYSSPANTFVAGFIGSPQMNFFNSSLILENRNYYILFHRLRLELPINKQVPLKIKEIEPREITIGIRPDHIHLSSGGSAIPAKIDVSELLGNVIHLHISIDGENAVLVLPISDSSEDMHTMFPYGSDISVEFNLNFVHLFDMQTGQNLLI